MVCAFLQKRAAALRDPEYENNVPAAPETALEVSTTLHAGPWCEQKERGWGGRQVLVVEVVGAAVVVSGGTC